MVIDKWHIKHAVLLCIWLKAEQLTDNFVDKNTFCGTRYLTHAAQAVKLRLPRASVREHNQITNQLTNLGDLNNILTIIFTFTP